MDYRDLAQELDTAIAENFKCVDFSEFIDECEHTDICPFHESGDVPEHRRNNKNPLRQFYLGLSERMRYSSNPDAQELGQELFLLLPS